MEQRLAGGEASKVRRMDGYARAAALMETTTVLLELRFDGEWRSMEDVMVVRGRPSKIEITNIVARSISTEVYGHK